jgi:hypothetical protein
MTAHAKSPLVGVWEQVGTLHPTLGTPIPWPKDSLNASVREFFCFFEDGTFRVFRFLSTADVQSFDPATREFRFEGKLDSRLEGTWRLEGARLVQTYVNRDGLRIDHPVQLGAFEPERFVVQEATPIPDFTLSVVYERYTRVAQPAPARHVSAAGLVAAAAPEGPGWRVEEVCGAAQGPTVATLVKAKRDVSGEFFFMLAKDYAVAPAAVRPAADLVRTVYAENYARMFQEVRYDFVQTTTVAGVEWVEAAMQMRHATMGSIAKIERVACAGTHVLILSAEGGQNEVRAHWPATQRWLADSRFRSLGQ